MLNRSKLWAVGLLFAVFAAGVAVGGAVSAAWGNDESRTATSRSEESRRRERVSYGERLQQSLDLSAAQREAVDSILARRQAAMDELWGKVRPEFKTLWSNVRTEVMAVLDEGQQVRYQELLARSDSARAARERTGRRHEH